MVERGALQAEYAYEIEIDDGTDYSHFYYANLIDTDNPGFLRFDPLFELGHEVERAVNEETLMVPYFRIVKVVKHKEEE